MSPYTYYYYQPFHLRQGAHAGKQKCAYVRHIISSTSPHCSRAFVLFDNFELCETVCAMVLQRDRKEVIPTARKGCYTAHLKGRR